MDHTPHWVAREKSIVPRLGWRYTIPETGVELSRQTFDQLVEAVRRHMVANGVQPSITLVDDVAAVACAKFNNPTAWCDDTWVDPNAPRSWSAADVAQFLNVAYLWIAKGAKHVEQAEADRRAAICAACPMNKPLTDGCIGCSAATSMVNSVRGDRRTPHDGDLTNCHVCACSLKAKVWLPLDVMQNDTYKFPPNCWMYVAPVEDAEPPTPTKKSTRRKRR